MLDQATRRAGLRRRQQGSYSVFRWIGIGVAVLLVGLIAFFVAAILLPPGFREGARDIFIVILASLQLIGAILTIALLIAVLFAVNEINKLARNTIVPKIDTAMTKVNELIDVVSPRIDTATVRVTEIVDNARTATDHVRDTSGAVTTTIVFVAERVVSPIIRISSLVAGVRAAATTLAQRDQKPEEESIQPQSS
jgi:hypothetical protein